MMDRLLNEMSDLVDQAEHQAHLQQLISMHQEAEPSTGQPSTSNPSTSRPSKSKQDVRWIKRDSDGNIIYGRPRSSRKQAAFLLQQVPVTARVERLVSLISGLLKPVRK